MQTWLYIWIHESTLTHLQTVVLVKVLHDASERILTPNLLKVRWNQTVGGAEKPAVELRHREDPLSLAALSSLLFVPYKTIDNYIVYHLASVYRVLCFYKALCWELWEVKGHNHFVRNTTCINGAWCIIRCALHFRWVQLNSDVP